MPKTRMVFTTIHLLTPTGDNARRMKLNVHSISI
jgi:hypothetical protein